MKTWTLIAIAFTAFACTSGNPSVRSAVIGPAGGTLSIDTDDNPALAGTSITVPAGALSLATTISIGPSAQSIAVIGGDAVGPVVDFEPSGTVFSIPATITLPATLPAGDVASDLFVEAVEADGAASSLTVQTFNGQAVGFQVNGFTSYGAFHRQSGASSGSLSTTTSGNGTSSAGGSLTTGGASSGASTSGQRSTSSGATGTTAGSTSSGGTNASSTIGGATGGTTGSPQSGGTATCSTSQDCMGLSGCEVIAIGDDGGFCGNLAIGRTGAMTSIAIGGWASSSFLAPNQLSLNTIGVGDWSIQMLLPCCPASPGTMATTAYVNNFGDGADCDGDYQEPGIITFDQVDGGLVGTLTVDFQGGNPAWDMNASFSLPSTASPGYCDAGGPTLGGSTTGVGSGTTSGSGSTTGGTTGSTTGGLQSGGTAACSATQECVGLSGCEALAIGDGGGFCGNLAGGRETEMASIAIGGWASSSFLAPNQLSLNTAPFGDWSIQMLLPCCPASPGTMAITAYVNNFGDGSACDGDYHEPGIITFDQVDGGLVGTLTVDFQIGAPAWDITASFSFPSTAAPDFCDAG